MKNPITLEELLAIQNVTSKRSANPDIIVIPKHKLAKLIRDKLSRPFNKKLLSMAVMIYCNRGYGVKLSLGKKKYNLIAEKVPPFLEWFFQNIDDGLYMEILEKFDSFSRGQTQRLKERGLRNSQAPSG